MIQPISTKICSICGLEKPYPADFIASHIKNKMSNQCWECRKKIKRQYRKNYIGNPETPRGWKDPENKFNQRLFPKRRFNPDG